MTTQCVVRAAECNSPWRGKCPKDKRGPSPARGPSRNETPDIPSGTYYLIKQYLSSHSGQRDEGPGPRAEGKCLRRRYIIENLKLKVEN